MKHISKLLALSAIVAMSFASCIDETFPESEYATSEQIGASASALDAAMSGIPSQMAQGYLIYGSQTHETDMAYPQYMIMMTEMLGDMYPLGTNSGYDWYRNYNTCTGSTGPTTYFSYIPWYTLYKFVKSANDIIAAVDVTSDATTDTMKGYLGMAYACRAFDYYMLTVLFEPAENEYTDVSSVKGLTVPIVTEATTGEDSKYNPRVSHDEMIEFILSDLELAEGYLSAYTPSTNLYPSLAVVYGLMAKVYLLDEQYAKAATYARKAIDTWGGTPMTETQWLDVTTAFNTANQAWMWYIHYDAENMGNLCNFIGWISGEADWGYASLTRPGIDRSLYDAINPTDFRKYAFLDPDKYSYYNYQTAQDEEYIEEAPDYLSIKFRCGSGNTADYATGGAVDVPIMRVEEMYLIEAEAIGMSQSVSAGCVALNSFMQSYRDPAYSYTGTDEWSFQVEVLKQMRIEFWGEGNALPSAKRIKPNIVKNYDGTNAPSDIFKINFKGINPVWNLCIPRSEVSANTAIDGYNNPDPSACVDYPTPIGEWATLASSAE